LTWVKTAVHGNRQSQLLFYEHNLTKVNPCPL
jgi:hypothetical protein